MLLHGPWGQSEGGSDLLVGQTVDDEAKDVRLAIGDPLEAGPREFEVTSAEQVCDTSRRGGGGLIGETILAASSQRPARPRTVARARRAAMYRARVGPRLSS